MEGDVGEDSVVQDSSSGPPRPDSEERASGSSSGCAKLNKLDCDNASEEPTPGPSNSAADFDLEVSSQSGANGDHGDHGDHVLALRRYLTLAPVVLMKNAGKSTRKEAR